MRFGGDLISPPSNYRLNPLMRSAGWKRCLKQDPGFIPTYHSLIFLYEQTDQSYEVERIFSQLREYLRKQTDQQASE
jgi:hypothetical protein